MLCFLNNLNANIKELRIRLKKNYKFEFFVRRSKII